MKERSEQLAVAFGLCLLAAAAPLLDMWRLWPLAAVGLFVSVFLLVEATRDEAVAPPVVSLLLFSLPAMWAADRLAVGSLAGAAIAIMLGEHLATMRHQRYATPGRTSVPLATTALLHAGAAVAAMLLTLVATLMPQARVWSLTTIAALVLVTVAMRRRRTAIPDVPLPPPTRLR